MLIKAQFTGADDFSEGLAAVSAPDANGQTKFGYIDKTGKIVIEPKYDYAFPFSDGLAQVAIQSGGTYGILRTGYIDSSGKYIWAPSS